MQLYNDELNRLVAYWSEGKDSRVEEILEYYDEIVLTRLKIRSFNTHISLRCCMNFEEIAEESTKREGKQITPSGIRKRAELAITTIKESFQEKYGK